MEKMKELEWNRQIFHLMLGIIIVALLMFGFIDQLAILILIIAGILLSFISRRMSLPLVTKLLFRFERRKDMMTFPGKGAVFYLIGVYISLLLYPLDIAMASILVLALGDSVSHLYGLHYGRIKHPLSDKKFLEGTVAGFLAGTIGALVFLPWFEAVPAALFAMVAEAIEVKLGTQQVDDNLIIPFIAGGVVWLIRLL